MKKIVLLLVSLFAINFLQAQQKIDDLTLVVSSDGATKEEATHLALRSAIEQAYGTFVSANTTIINDEIVKDEIATVASGNIKEYKELSSILQNNGRYYVMLEATVSINKLITYAKSKGSSCELAGATFAQNVKLYRTNKKAAEIVISNLLSQLREMAPYLFDYRIEVSNPVVSNPNAADGEPIYGIVNAVLYLDETPVAKEFQKLLYTTIDAITFDWEQAENYKKMGIEVFEFPAYLWDPETRKIEPKGGYSFVNNSDLNVFLRVLFATSFSSAIIYTEADTCTSFEGWLNNYYEVKYSGWYHKYFDDHCSCSRYLDEKDYISFMYCLTEVLVRSSDAYYSDFCWDDKNYYSDFFGLAEPSGYISMSKKLGFRTKLILNVSDFNKVSEFKVIHAPSYYNKLFNSLLVEEALKLIDKQK